MPGVDSTARYHCLLHVDRVWYDHHPHVFASADEQQNVRSLVQAFETCFAMACDGDWRSWPLCDVFYSLHHRRNLVVHTEGSSPVVRLHTDKDSPASPSSARRPGTVPSIRSYHRAVAWTSWDRGMVGTDAFVNGSRTCYPWRASYHTAMGASTRSGAQRRCASVPPW